MEPPRACSEEYLPLLVDTDDRTAYGYFVDTWDNGELSTHTDGEREMYLQGWLDYACSARTGDPEVGYLDWTVGVADGIVVATAYRTIGYVSKAGKAVVSSEIVERQFVWPFPSAGDTERRTVELQDAIKRAAKRRRSGS